jgi:hypothetical protein
MSFMCAASLLFEVIIKNSRHAGYHGQKSGCFGYYDRTGSHAGYYAWTSKKPAYVFFGGKRQGTRNPTRSDGYTNYGYGYGYGSPGSGGYGNLGHGVRPAYYYG